MRRDTVVQLQRTHWQGLDVTLYGNAANPTIVFLHGFLGSAVDWQTLCAHLAQDYYCVAPDLPGATAADRSRRSYSTMLSLERVADELESALSSYCEEVSVVGYSMGGRIALSLLQRCALPIRAAAFLSTHPGIADPAMRAARRALDAQRAQQCRDGFLPFLTEWYRSSVFSSLEHKPELRAGLINSRLETNDQDWAAKLLTELSPGVAGTYWSAIAEWTFPQLWLAGADDAKYLSVLTSLSQASTQRTLRTQVIADCGHAIHLEQPAAAAMEIKKWLAAAGF